MTRPRTIAAAVAACALAALAFRPAAAPVSVRLLAFNDFHGNLEPPEGSNGRIAGVTAGGVEYLSTHLTQLKAGHPNTLVVAAGDNIGASPLISGLFHDEPTIEALNTLGLAVTSVGNHEFDEGWVELLRMQNGGCHPVDGCQDKTPFAGARFQYLAANVGFHAADMDPALLKTAKVASTDPRTTLFPPYVIKTIGGVKIAFVGMTLKGTPAIVSPGGIKHLRFDDEDATAAQLVPKIEQLGVHAIVLLIHQGGEQQQDGDPNACNSFSGDIVDVVTQLPEDIGVVVSAHTHRAYNCTIAGRLVTSASSFGRVITTIDLTIDPATDRIVSKSAKNEIVTRDVAKDPKETAIIDHYRPFYTAMATRVIGKITGTINRRASAAGEQPLGDVIADSQWAFAQKADAAVVAAFMNTGGIRGDLTAAEGGPTDVTYEQAYTVQPFGNHVIVKTMTGDMLRRLLEQQFTAAGDARNVLQVSSGFSYQYDPKKSPGQRVDVQTISIAGKPWSANATYRVAMNEFLANGGDGFSVFTEGTNALDTGVDVDALEQYFATHSPIAPPAPTRIKRAN